MIQERKNKGENYTSFESPLKGDSLHIKLELSLGLLRLRNITMQSTTLLPTAQVIPTNERTGGPIWSLPRHAPQLVVSAGAVVSSFPQISSLARPWPPSSSRGNRTPELTLLDCSSEPRDSRCFSIVQIQFLLETQIQQAKEDAFFLLVRIPASI